METLKPLGSLNGAVPGAVPRAIENVPRRQADTEHSAPSRRSVPIYRDGDCQPDDPHTLFDRMRR